MASFMKMFKNKKGSNKENLPNMNRSALERSSVGSSDFLMNRSDAGVYIGEPRQSREMNIPNPYSVVTAPKTTRGPRSCPGAPMDDRSYRSSNYRGKPLNDRYSSLNSSLRYENVGRKRSEVYQHETILEYSSESANSSRGSPPEVHSRKDITQHMQLRRSQKQRYYSSALNESTDDDEGANMHIIQLEAKLKRAKELIRTTRRDLTERIEELQDEVERKIRDYDTLKWHYKQARKAVEDERKINARQAKKLHQAMEEVNRLKTMLAEHSNDSSFLVPYCGGLPPMGYDTGAGEALAEAQIDGASDRLCSLNEVRGGSVSDGLSSQTEHTNTRESTAEPTLKLDNQEDMQDEVRVFRTAECDTPPPERPRAAVAGSPIDPLSSYVPLPDFSVNNDLVPQRSLSDTDIRALVLQEAEKEELRKEQQSPIEKEYQSCIRSIKKNYDFYVKGYNEKMDDDGSVSSSDEERCRLIEKQLKKKGELVRFQPPRATVQPRHYKRFGKLERCALAEFDYLQDISTDVSALQSSPEAHHNIAI